MTRMNLSPTIEELSQSILALQDYMNDSFEGISPSSVSPEDFTEILRSHFCDFLDSSHTVELALQKTIDAMCAKYEDVYNKSNGLAKVYNLSDYRNTTSTRTASRNLELAEVLDGIDF